MNGFEKYSIIITARVNKLIEEEALENNPEWHEVFKNHLLGLQGPKQLVRKLTPADIRFSKLSSGFFEVNDSYYSLLDIEVYIGRFPYGNTGVSKTRYLAYHMGNYLNEVYILKERLKSYFTTVGRLYRDDMRIQGILKPLSDFVINGLRGIIDVRSEHVHKKRIVDENISRLSTFELIFKNGGKEVHILRNIYDFDYRSIRKSYKQTIKQNNEQIKKMLDACFDILCVVVANDKRQIKPAATKKSITRVSTGSPENPAPGEP